jgi:hypothetical protein
MGERLSLSPFPGLQQSHDGELIVRHALHAAEQMGILGGKLPGSFLGSNRPRSQGERQERKENREIFPGHRSTW